MCEDRHRVYEIEAFGRLGQWRSLGTDEEAERRRQLRIRPIDAFAVNIAADELRLVGFVRESRECTSGSTAEIQDCLAGKGPVIRQNGFYETALSGANFTIFVVRAADPRGQCGWWNEKVGVQAADSNEPEGEALTSFDVASESPRGAKGFLSRVYRYALQTRPGRSSAAIDAGAESGEAVGPPAEPEVAAEPEWMAQVRRDEENMRRLIATSLKTDDNCIDVGAHTGAVLAHMVSAAPRGRHIAYEPIPHLAEALRSGFPQVDVRCAAVSDHVGTATFAHVVQVPEWSGLRSRPLPDGSEPEVEQIEVRLETLDETLRSGYIPALIKIDVEGGEEAVIEGAIDTLRRHRPLVLFEHGVGSANVYGTTPCRIYELLVEQIGMEIFDLDERGPYTVDEFERAYYANERVNFLAR